MEIVATNYTIADDCEDLGQNKITVNREYQRSDKVWPPAAKSFLIESILLGYPIPKISLFQRIDVKTRKAVKEIIDGQQRTVSILDFHSGKLRLSRTFEAEEFAGASYFDLSEELQSKFLNQSLSVDLFVAATNQEIREVFRRMNSYTVPLNPEETRHATWQGEFKWFIYSLTQRADVIFKEIGTFGEKAFVRMQDAKLFTEIVDAMFYGIRTTNRTMLDSLYRKWDDCFPEKDDFSEYIMAALYKIFDWKEIHNGPLVKPHMIYSLILAVMYLVRPTFPLKDYYPLENPVEIKDDQAILDLSYLADALESENHPTELVSFVDASSSKTNVASNRIERFTTFCRVIS